MVSIEKRRYLKRAALVATGLFVLLYCLASLLYVWGQPWKGFYVYSGREVAGVNRESSAYEAGLRPGDLIVSINGLKVNDPLDVVRVTKKLTLGETASIVYTRADQLQPPAQVRIIRTPFPLKLLLWMICSFIIITTGYVFHYRRS